MNHEYRVPINGEIVVSAANPKEAARLAKRWAAEVGLGLGNMAAINDRHAVFDAKMKTAEPKLDRVYTYLSKIS